MYSTTKGTKTKPGLITLSDKRDYRLGGKVAFDISTQIGQLILSLFNKQIPNDASIHIDINGIKKEFILGVVNKEANQRTRKKSLYNKLELQSFLRF